MNRGCCKTMMKTGSKTSSKKQFRFPAVLHRMLQDASTDGNDHILSWTHDGRAFQINDYETFENVILPRYGFKTRKFRSFQRQLSFYGFFRPNYKCHEFYGSYWHPFFIQCNPSLSNKITNKRTTKKYNSDKDNDDDDDKSTPQQRDFITNEDEIESKKDDEEEETGEENRPISYDDDNEYNVVKEETYEYLPVSNDGGVYDLYSSFYKDPKRMMKQNHDSSIILDETKEVIIEEGLIEACTSTSVQHDEINVMYQTSGAHNNAGGGFHLSSYGADSCDGIVDGMDLEPRKIEEMILNPFLKRSGFSIMPARAPKRRTVSDEYLSEFGEVRVVIKQSTVQ